jgi:hypothetical protein
METTVCEKCGEALSLGEWPFCPHGAGKSNVITDDIPGGVLIYHGICNSDGTPRRYYSKSEMTKEAKRRGLVNHVEHKTDPKSGSDKNPHTTRWI